MDGNLYYGLNIQLWVFIGIVVYSCLIFLVIIIRQCVLKKSFCPFCKCQTYNPLTTTGYNCDLCFNCSTRDSSWCCRKGSSLPEPSCCLCLPFCKWRCFPPDCSYCHCICCEFACESRAKVGSKNIDDDFD